MKTLNKVTILWLALIVSLVFVGAALFPIASEASEASVPGYIALGDSIEFGVGATNFNGYVLQFSQYLAQVLGTQVDLHNLSKPGATTKDIANKQLHPAITEIENHRSFGVVVSWGGGGGDLLNFITSPQAATCRQDPSCLARLNALLNEIEQTADRTIKKLRSAAGPESTILVRTQYNSLLKPGCDPTGGQLAGLASAALEGLPGTILEQGFNDRLRAIAAKYDAKVVDIFGPFFQNPDGLIAADCAHPNDAGHTVIFQMSVAAFGTP